MDKERAYKEAMKAYLEGNIYVTVLKGNKSEVKTLVQEKDGSFTLNREFFEAYDKIMEKKLIKLFN